MLQKHLSHCREILSEDEMRLRPWLHPQTDGLSLPYSITHASLPLGEASMLRKLEAQEVYIFLQGVGLLYLNGESQRVGKNDLVFAPANSEQYLENIGIEDLVFLQMQSPAPNLEHK